MRSAATSTLMSWEYPQSGERFRGIANIRAQFENYPGLVPGTTFLEEIVDGTTYALTQIYTSSLSRDRETAASRSTASAIPTAAIGTPSTAV